MKRCWKATRPGDGWTEEEESGIIPRHEVCTTVCLVTTPTKMGKLKEEQVEEGNQKFCFSLSKFMIYQREDTKLYLHLRGKRDHA